MQPDPNEIQKIKDRIEKLESNHASPVQIILHHGSVIVINVAITLTILKSLSLLKF